MRETTKKINGQEWRFLNFLRPLITAGLPLIKSVLTQSAKSVLIPLGLPAGITAADAAIQKKIYGSNEEMEDIMKKIKSLEESGLLIKGISETIKYEAKEQKGRFLSMLWWTSAASILKNALPGKGIIWVHEGVWRAGQTF